MIPTKAVSTRDLLVFVAIVASAVTWHVRQHAVMPTPGNVAASQVEYGRSCEPTTSSTSIGEGREARMVPADCGTRANVRQVRAVALWV